MSNVAATAVTPLRRAEPRFHRAPSSHFPAPSVAPTQARTTLLAHQIETLEAQFHALTSHASSLAPPTFYNPSLNASSIAPIPSIDGSTTALITPYGSRSTVIGREDMASSAGWTEGGTLDLDAVREELAALREELQRVRRRGGEVLPEYSR